MALREFVGSSITLLQDDTVVCGDTAVTLHSFDEKNCGENEQEKEIIDLENPPKSVKFQTVDHKYREIKENKEEPESVRSSLKLSNSFKMLNHDGQNSKNLSSIYFLRSIRYQNLGLAE